VAYFVFLCYIFAGIAIIADLFMDGIMQITSIKKKVKRKNERGETVIVEEPVWNWCVAAQRTTHPLPLSRPIIAFCACMCRCHGHARPEPTGQSATCMLQIGVHARARTLLHFFAGLEYHRHSGCGTSGTTATHHIIHKHCKPAPT
jgi:hypothetical protein